MLNPDDRYYIWRKYKEKARKFLGLIEDDLLYQFAPRKQSEADKDTPNVRKLFDILEGLYDFINAHCEELEVEVDNYETIQANLSKCFDAWCYGLCPNVVGKISHSFYEEIAQFKQSEGISYEDTQNAVQLWHDSMKATA